MNHKLTGCLVAFATLIFSNSAGATGTIECTGVETSDVSAFISVGRVPVLAVLGARFEAGGQVWATDGPLVGEGEQVVRIVFGQGVDDRSGLRADFTDENVSEIVVSLRTVRASDDKLDAEAGVLSIAGQGVWAVTCQNG